MSETGADISPNTDQGPSSEPADDLRSIIEAASRGELQDEAPAEAEPTVTRDENGRFTSTKPAADGAAVEGTEPADKPTTTAEEPAAPAIAPPQAWSAT